MGGLEGPQLGGMGRWGQGGRNSWSKGPMVTPTFKAGVGVRPLHLAGGNKDLRSDVVGGWQPCK